MQAIDKNAVRDAFMNAVYAECAENAIKLQVNNMISLFDALPTIETEPVRHGKWRGDNPPTRFWHCSECKGLTETAHSCYHCYYRFCPNCGAKMDGGAEK